MNSIIKKCMGKGPLVSIITPCFNDGKYIKECVESVQNSTYRYIEHIIVDDGSTDLFTHEVLDSLCYENVTIIKQVNQGVCVARNIGVNKASGEYILPLDADDMISTDYVKAAVLEFLEDSKIKLVTTNYTMFGKNNRNIKVQDYSLELLLGQNLFINCSMFRKSDFLAIGGYSLNMINGLEDWDFWIKLLSSGGSVSCLNENHFFYRIKNINESRNSKVNFVNDNGLRKSIWENNKLVFSRTYFNPKKSVEFLLVYNSLEYQIGKVVLKPIRKIVRFIKNI